MRTSVIAVALLIVGGAALAAPRIWLEHTDVPEALMVSNDSGVDVPGCTVEWTVHYDSGRHYTEIAKVDLPANGTVKIGDCGEWWDERRSKTLDVDLLLTDPAGAVLAQHVYQGVFTVVPRQGLPTDGWSATASRGANTAAAFDADPGTRWDTGGKQEVGDWYTLDMGKEQRVVGLIVDTRGSAEDYPSGLKVEVSTDDRAWTTAADIQDTGPLTVRGRTKIAFDAVTARYIRLTLTKTHGDTWFWSIHELSVLPPA